MTKQSPKPAAQQAKCPWYARPLLREEDQPEGCPIGCTWAWPFHSEQDVERAFEED